MNNVRKIPHRHYVEVTCLQMVRLDEQVVYDSRIGVENCKWDRKLQVSVSVE